MRATSQYPSLRILAVDLGGSHVKVLLRGRTTPRRAKTGPDMTPTELASAMHRLTRGWRYDVVSMGYPGVVWHGRPVAEPHNLGRGWVTFDYRKVFGDRPIEIINDAAMQAIGSYAGGRMLFLGLGTGLGSAFIVNGVVEPMELGHLPYKKGRTYEQYLGADGLKRLGRKKWERCVHDVVQGLRAALEADYVVLGGGNVHRLRGLPEGARTGGNANAFIGAFRMWLEPGWRRTGTTRGSGRARRGAASLLDSDG
jgi:polyphosphate glucokinase